MSVTEPGLVHGMSDDEYHSDPIEGGSLSSTFARLLTEHVPAKALAIRQNRRPTKSMNLGKAAHRHALGAGPLLITWQHDGRTKAGKEERAEWADRIASEEAVAVTESERTQIEDMVTALMSNPEVVDIFATADAEVSGFWQEATDDGDVWLRSRLDLLGDLAWDYKTADDVSGRGFEKAMATYGYHQQAQFYQRGLLKLGHEAGRKAMRFICQESSAPYLVQIHTCDDLALEIARVLNDRAIDLYAACNTTNKWPGHVSLEAEPTALPNYYYFRHEAVIPPNLNPFTDEVA